MAFPETDNGVALPGIGLRGEFVENASGWAAEMNHNLVIESIVARGWAISRTTSIPATGSTGDVYIVPSGAGTNPNQLAAWVTTVGGVSSWRYHPPQRGMVMRIGDESDAPVTWNGSAWVAAAFPSHVHDAADVTSGTFDAARFPASGVVADTYGSGSLVPVITVDATGRLTSATTAAVSGGGGASAINDLTDVTITTPADNEVLAYDNGTSTWINQTPAEAGLATASHTHTLSDVSDSGALAAMNTVAAGQIDANAVTEAKLDVIDSPADGEVLSFQTASGRMEWIPLPAGGSNAINDLTDVNITTPADNEVLAYDTTSGDWINQTPAEAGLAAASHTHTLSAITDSGALAALSTIATAQIDNNAVTLAKLADMATASFIGRATAATGDPEILSAAQARTILNVENGATADQTGAEIASALDSELGTGWRTANWTEEELTGNKTLAAADASKQFLAVDGTLQTITINATSFSNGDAAVVLAAGAGGISVVAGTGTPTIENFGQTLTNLPRGSSAWIGRTNDTYYVLVSEPATEFVRTTDAASTTASGIVELATAAETTTGADATRAVTPDALSGSVFGTQVVQLLVFDDSEDVVVGDGAGDLFFRVPSTMNGMNLVAVAAQVQTAGTTGTTDVQIHNVTQAADMLTTKITIDSAETDSSTATTAAVIDTANDDVATGDSLRIDVDAAATTAPKGLLVEMQFRLP